MTTLEPSSVSDLPALAEVADPSEWAADLLTTARGLLDRGIRLVRSADGGVFVLGNAELRALAGHPAVGNAPADFLMSRSERRFRNSSGHEGCPLDQEALAHFLDTQLFTMNPPEHTPARRRLSRPLMPKPVMALEGLAAEVGEGLLGELASGAEFDFSSGFSGPFVNRFWTQALGIPVERAARIQALMEDMNIQFYFEPTADEVRRARAATAEYMAVVESAVGSAWSHGPTALLTQLVEGMGHRRNRPSTGEIRIVCGIQLL